MSIELNGNGHHESNGGPTVITTRFIFTPFFGDGSQLALIGKRQWLYGHHDIPGGIKIDGLQGDETEVTEWYAPTPQGEFDLTLTAHQETNNEFYLFQRKRS